MCQIFSLDVHRSRKAAVLSTTALVPSQPLPFFTGLECQQCSWIGVNLQAILSPSNALLCPCCGSDDLWDLDQLEYELDEIKK